VTDDLSGFTPEDMVAMQDWITFYETSTEYKFVGVVQGKFYDKFGNPTPYLKHYTDLAKQGLQERQEKEKAKLQEPPCNSKWTQDTGAEVWCTKKSGGISRSWVGVPRKRFSQRKGKSTECVCVRTAELAKQDPTLQIYEGCDPEATRCLVSK